MPEQLTLATQCDAGFEAHRKTTRRDVFLAEMDKVVPWAELCAVIEPFYPKPRADGGGRPTVGLERMLRIHFLQQWYALSDPAVEEALYDSAAMRRFVGIDLGREGAPDETTLCKFRHLLERHGVADHLFAAVGEHLKQHRFKLSQGTIVDATIIAAAPSTKNKAKTRDPDMHQTKKGQQWYFGMKAHIGVDAESGMVHTVTGTAANVADVIEVPSLLHGKERHVFVRRGLPRRRETRAEARAEVLDRGQAQRGESHRRSQAARHHRRTGACEGLDPRCGGASAPGAQAPVRLREGALQGPGQEHGTGDDAVRAGQSVDGTQASTDFHGIGASKRHAIPPRVVVRGEKHTGIGAAGGHPIAATRCMPRKKTVIVTNGG